ncbi:Oxoglutarate and iron-dependent oxygenase degradation C-term-domain-containing protein [Gorgonomyces haynaldii]|nr:Oxoglutarate and iron-dependent oxygenase degradation C-term-domain-containing protein [Gorgonomyces haynaldii]
MDGNHTKPKSQHLQDEIIQNPQNNENAKQKDKLRQEYLSSKPYKHSRILNLVDDQLLRNVRKEIQKLSFTEKETDIYKVNQTGDLANLDGLENVEKQLPSLFRLRNGLYSREFREFMIAITGCGHLSATKIDLSINKYSQGCHLLNHDDVIGTRKVSFILYLPDPEDEWLPEYGGALELYPVLEKGTPKNEPTVVLAPVWNSFSFFAVQPGHSFHSVEEVVAQKERISISGWFHAPVEGEEGFGTEQEPELKSTLEQLLLGEFSGFKDCEKDIAEPLTPQELVYLKEYLNPSYLKLSTLEQLNDLFVEQSHVLLAQILHPRLSNQIEESLKAVDERDLTGSMTKHGAGAGTGWECQGPPHLRRYLVANDENQDEASKCLSKVSALFQSKAFHKWLGLLISVALVGCRSNARRFRPGLDYSLALSNPEPVLHVQLCLTPSNPVWEDGQIGGYTSYMMPHDELDAAVYKAAALDDDVLLTLPASWNQMVIVLRDQGVLHFCKYVSASAPSSRWDVDAEYTVQMD